MIDAQAELDRQIGLSRVKDQIERYRAATQMAKVRAARGMKVAQQSKHIIFTGPPGTGKTTIARVVANILAGLGVIAEPKLVETSRKDFVAEYEGQSSVKTARTIDRALGGVLFIDEAYTLVQERDGRADPFGTEALDTLLARMENDRDRLVVIIAGYSADIDRLLEVNDGLRSRFSTRVEFDSYSPDEIVDIAKVLAASNDSTLSEEAGKRVLEAATLLSQRALNGKPALDIAGNGRYARQLVEAGEQYRDMRLARSVEFDSLGVEQLSEINGEDMTEAIDAVHARLSIVRVAPWPASDSPPRSRSVAGGSCCAASSTPSCDATPGCSTTRCSSTAGQCHWASSSRSWSASAQRCWRTSSRSASAAGTTCSSTAPPTSCTW